jgi:RecA-family ATPase
MRDFSTNPSEMSNGIVPTNTSALMEIKVGNIVSTNLLPRTDLAKSYFDVFAPTPYHDHHLIIGPKGVGKTSLTLQYAAYGDQPWHVAESIPGGIIYLSAEEGCDEFVKSMQELIAKLPIKKSELPKYD